MSLDENAVLKSQLAAANAEKEDKEAAHNTLAAELADLRARVLRSDNQVTLHLLPLSLFPGS